MLIQIPLTYSLIHWSFLFDNVKTNEIDTWNCGTNALVEQ